MGLVFINQNSGGGGGGTVTGANNGLTLSGANAQLGGTTILNTTISIGSTLNLTFSYPYIGGAGTFVIDQSTNRFEFNNFDTSGLVKSSLKLKDASILLQVAVSGLTSNINIDINGSITCSDNVFTQGIKYTGNYSATFIALSCVSKNYVDAAVLPIAKVVSSFRNTTLSLTTTLLTYNIGATGSELYIINVAFVVVSGAGSYNIAVTYFDATNNLRTVILAAAVVLGTPSYIPPLVISPFSNTNIIVTATITGSANAQAFGTIEYYPV